MLKFARILLNLARLYCGTGVDQLITFLKYVCSSSSSFSSIMISLMVVRHASDNTTLAIRAGTTQCHTSLQVIGVGSVPQNYVRGPISTSAT